jgi:hypothetical protein
MKIVKIVLEDTWYIGYYFDLPITKQKTLTKCLRKLEAYIKGLGR